MMKDECVDLLEEVSTLLGPNEFIGPEELEKSYKNINQALDILNNKHFKSQEIININLTREQLKFIVDILEVAIDDVNNKTLANKLKAIRDTFSL